MYGFVTTNIVNLTVVCNLIAVNHSQTIYCMYFSCMNRTRKNELPPVVIELGEKIKKIIEDNNLKQREVAYDAGMDVENLRKYMKGNQQMKVSTVFRIAEALGTTASDLLNGLQTKKEG